MSKGWARSVTRAAPFASCWTISRRVGSESALKARSRTGVVIYSTYGLNIADRKSTRLNSSHSQISYAVFCLKKKNKNKQATLRLGTIDDLGKIFVNGQHVADTDDWSQPHSFDVAQQLHAGKNNITVIVRNNA